MPAAATPPLLAAKKEGVLTLTLNRPDALNSFTVPMMEGLHAALKDAAKDASVRVVLLTGAGRAFCVGQDLREHMERRPSFLEDLRERFNPLVVRLRELEKPVVAAVNGAAAGAGMSLALACDIRLASAAASFHTAFIKIGLVADSGNMLFLSKYVGFGRAMELLLTGRPVEASEAERIGLVSRVVEPARLAAEADALCRELAKGPGRAYGLMKRMANETLFASGLSAQLDYEAQLQETAGRTKDHAEGLAAFLEKRAPRFAGE